MAEIEEGWVKPICAACYRLREPGRRPLTLHPKLREDEHCCLCQAPTREGIYYGIDPERPERTESRTWKRKTPYKRNTPYPKRKAK